MALVCTLALVGFACGEDLAAQVDRLATEACACTDSACGEALKLELMRLTRKGSKEPPEAERTRMLQALERWRACEGRWLTGDIDRIADEACACPDADCARKAQKKLLDLVERVGKDTEPSAADQQEIMKSVERMTECVAKISG